VFVAGFLVVGAVQAVTGFIPAVPSAATAIPQKAETQEKYTFTGKSSPVKPGSLPVKRWEELVNKWGKKCKTLTPALLAAQLEQESAGFAMDVVTGERSSPAGAKGIAQFMDATWTTEAVDGNGDGKKNKFDPEDAIPSAATFDCKLAKGLKGIPGPTWKNMLAGYNAGGFRVQQYNGVPPCSFAKCETYNYVKMIEQKTRKYEQ
jgi:soluble lytic murein transglycosylase-like protein